MKKRVAIFASIAVILLGILIIWYNTSIDLMDLDPNDVMEIVVFNDLGVKRYDLFER